VELGERRLIRRMSLDKIREAVQEAEAGTDDTQRSKRQGFDTEADENRESECEPREDAGKCFNKRVGNSHLDSLVEPQRKSTAIIEGQMKHRQETKGRHLMDVIPAVRRTLVRRGLPVPFNIRRFESRFAETVADERIECNPRQRNEGRDSN
jgi:hypothetical protein